MAQEVNNRWQGLPRFIRNHGHLRPVVNDTRRQRKVNAKIRRLLLKYEFPIPAHLRRKGD